MFFCIYIKKFIISIDNDKIIVYTTQDDFF